MNRSHSWVFALVAIAATLSTTNAVACSCAGLTLEARYEMSRQVFTAVMLEKYDEPNAFIASQRTTFRVTDTFKGNRPFTTLVSNLMSAMCGIDLELGREYLVFAPDSGEVGLCTVQDVGEAKDEIAALEAFAAGRHADLAEPWRFTAAEQGCSLETRFEVARDRGLGLLTIASSREAPRPPFDGLRFVSPVLAIQLPDHVLAPGRSAHPPLTLAVGDSSYKAGRLDEFTIEVANERGETFPLPFPAVYVLNGSDVEVVVRQLVSSGALTIRYGMEGFGPNVDIRVRTTNLGDSGTEMLDCLRSHRNPQ